MLYSGGVSAVLLSASSQNPQHSIDLIIQIEESQDLQLSILPVAPSSYLNLVHCGMQRGTSSSFTAKTFIKKQFYIN